MCSTDSSSNAYLSKMIHVKRKLHRVPISEVCEFYICVDLAVEPVFYLRSEMLVSTDPQAQQNVQQG